MKVVRRQLLRWVAAAATIPVVSRIAMAQTYPTKTVRWVVGYTPGGGNDIFARLIGQWLQDRLGQPFVIENRPGAGSNIATELVANAPADGYTLLLSNFANATNASLYRNQKFDFIRDIMPVAGIVRVPNAMLVNPSVPAKTVPEFITYAKANPGKVNMASAGQGSTGHLAGELFKMMTGAGFTHVPYRGNGPALADLLGGQVQFVFASLPSSLEFIKSGKLRGIAVTSANRSDALPDIPTVAESVPDYEVSSWYGIGVPRNTPAEVIATLNKEVNAALADPKMKAKLADLGGLLIGGSPGAFGKLIVDETAKWAKVIKFAGIKPQ
jgi:tripartite-type tricarboxylate transporter receptor subunit TctC